MKSAFFTHRAKQKAVSPASAGTEAFDEGGFIRARFNVKSADVSKSELPRGQGSLALTQFSDSNGPFLVCKTIKNKGNEGELAFMKELMDVNEPVRRCFQIRWPFPEVYHVEDRGTESDIFLQFVEGVSTRRNPSFVQLARPLAVAIHELSLVLPTVCRIEGLSLPSRGGAGSSFLSEVETLLPGTGDDLRALLRFQRQLPHGLCHNDIFWPNIGISFVDQKPEFTFIDFGMLGTNVVGSELHHFARRSVKSKKDADFFRRVHRNFASLTRIDERLIEMNAYLYAAMRLMAFEKSKDTSADLEDVKQLCLAALQCFDAFYKSRRVTRRKLRDTCR